MNFSDLPFLSVLTTEETMWLFFVFYLIKWLYRNHKERANYELATKAFFDDFVHNTKNLILTEPHEEPHRMAIIFLGVDWKQAMQDFNKDNKDYWKRYYYLLKIADSYKFRKSYLELCEVYGIKDRCAFKKWLKERDDAINTERTNKTIKRIKKKDIWEGYKLNNEFDYESAILGIN